MPAAGLYAPASGGRRRVKRAAPRILLEIGLDAPLPGPSERRRADALVVAAGRLV
ncbi:MAG: hypothetical protein JWR86_531, partial [Enterovirga sp.]|nr:hypothetical protein [Enterovirga sp.]